MATQFNLDKLKGACHQFHNQRSQEDFLVFLDVQCLLIHVFVLDWPSIFALSQSRQAPTILPLNL